MVYLVASFAEAWIEIAPIRASRMFGSVASFAEAWIEILIFTLQTKDLVVASFAEAWIEIQTLKGRAKGKNKSPPSRRRGLKSYMLVARIPLLRRLLRGGVD